MAKESEMKQKSVDPATLEMLEKVRDSDVDATTMWDRYETMQPQCRFGELGICCTICLQGPCRINPFGKEPSRGICGATAYTIVSRNLLRKIAAGCSAHSDHGRHIAHTMKALVDGKADAYSIKDEDKLRVVAQRVGIDVDGKDTMELTKELLGEAFEDFSRVEHEPLTWLRTTLTPRRLEMLDRYGVLPSNIDAAVVEIMHRTHIGVDADPVPLIFSGIKCALADLAGEHISTDLSDILFGTPMLTFTESNLGVLKKESVNIAMNGHNPVLSEIMCDIAEEMKGAAEEVGADGINIVGICCTGNELLMRRGIPLATNFASQELAIMTGVLDAMVIDYQCILPSLGMWANCFHTKLISTSDLCRQTGDIHIEFNPASAKEDARRILLLAINAYKDRNENAIHIPDVKETSCVGFSVEQIMEILSKASDDPLQYLADKLKEGKIQGFAALVGCNNVKTCHDLNHLTLAKEFIKNDILVISTGCAAGAYVRAGLTNSKATKDLAGEGLKEVLTELGEKFGFDGPFPPVWHMGSCVDNSRIHDFMTMLANKMGIDIKDLPVVASAPEDMSEKAVVIGTWLVATGWPTHVAVLPFIHGSPLVVQIAENTARDVYGGYFVFEEDPDEAARKLVNIVKNRRWRLGIGEDKETIYWSGETKEDVFAEKPEVAADGGEEE
ncbi:MAG: anaerobic carbon-monoxide dehydrogenase catalytic subunit [Candidatus Thermoplasmatota archaeon]|nr:anaerobic carbon-monoxide dehydrogenase catalytic subunit [Candidatus Thermoplasmatota archaeon]